MALVRPSLSSIKGAADRLGITLSESEAKSYLGMVDDVLAGYEVLETVPEQLPEVKYPRSAGERPPADENPYNAWARKLTVAGGATGRLAGKRVVLKDSICLAGVPMSVGAPFVDGYVPPVDATIVTRMLDEAATIIGKATCENLCFSGSSHTSWPAPVLNPLAPDRSAGGSSSGSAVLVATGEADMSLGADQGGSIRVPAAWCGIVGMKPTYGLVPYTGVFSIEATVDHVGPMTANVADNALLLEVIAGPDGLDPRQQGVKTAAYTKEMTRGVAGLRIGILTEAFATEEADPQVSHHVYRAAQSLADLGAIVEEISVPVHHIARPIWAPILIEGATDLLIHGSPTNLGGLYIPGASSAITAWKGRSGDLSVPAKVTLLASEIIRQTYGRSFYGKSQNLVRMVRQAYDEALSRFDLLVMPTTPQLPTALPPSDAPLEDVWQVALNMNLNTCPFCATGHPSLSVPSGLVNGLPVGLMFVGRRWEEATIYAAAYAYEQAHRVDGA